MPGIELIRSLFQQANAQGSKSTALTPLGWALLIMVGGLLAAIHYSAPFWVIVIFVVFTGVVLGIYLFAYIYFMLSAPEMLRTEKFTLSKMAMERSIFGDSLQGLTDPSNTTLLKALPDGNEVAQPEKR